MKLFRGDDKPGHGISPEDLRYIIIILFSAVGWSIFLLFYNPQWKMARIKSVDYFRVPLHWLFVQITDEDGHYGWGESTLEGC